MKNHGLPWRMISRFEVHEALCGPQPNPQLAHCRGGELGSDAVHGVGSDAMRTAGVVTCYQVDGVVGQTCKTQVLAPQMLVSWSTLW